MFALAVTILLEIHAPFLPAQQLKLNLAGDKELDIGLLVKQLRSPDAATSFTACLRLKELGTTAAAALPGVLAALDDVNWHVRGNAATVIGSMGKAASSATPFLACRLGDSEPNVRFAAAHALGDIGPGAKGAVEALKEALDDEDVGHRIVYAEALWRIDGNAVAISALVRSLGDQNKWNRIFAAAVLGETGAAGRPALPSLVKLLRDHDAAVRVRAAQTLWEIEQNRAGVLVLLREVRDQESLSRYRAALVLWRIEKHPAAMQVLRAALREGDCYEKLLALIALHDIGPEAREALPDLQALETCEEEVVVQTVKKVIERVRGQRSEGK